MCQSRKDKDIDYLGFDLYGSYPKTRTYKIYLYDLESTRGFSLTKPNKIQITNWIYNREIGKRYQDLVESSKVKDE